MPSVEMVMREPEARKWVWPLSSSVARVTGSSPMFSVTVAGAVQVMVYQVPGMVFSSVSMVWMI